MATKKMTEEEQQEQQKQEERADLIARLWIEKEAAQKADLTDGYIDGRAAARKASYREFLYFKGWKECLDSYGGRAVDFPGPWEVMPEWATDQLDPNYAQHLLCNEWALGWINGLLSVWEEIEAEVQA